MVTKMLFEIAILCFIFVLLESSGGNRATSEAFIFPSTIVKGWHRFGARWSQQMQERQLRRLYIMAQSLVWTSSFMLKRRENTSQEQAWATTTLFQRQWRTRAAQSWPGNMVPSHLMRWRYSILTHPPKCKITRTEFNWKWSGAFNITQTSN